VNFRGHKGIVTNARFNPDGSSLVTASEDNTAKIWNTKTGQLLFTLNAHTSCVNSAEFSPKGNYVLTGSCDGTFRLWNTSTGRIHQTIALTGTGRVSRASFSPCATKILVLTMEGIEAGVWDLTQSKYIFTLRGHTGILNSACYSSDGSRILTTSEDNTARVWDAKSGRLLFTYLAHQDAVQGGRFLNADGTQAFTFSADKQAKVWNCTTGTFAFTIDAIFTTLSTGYYSEKTKRLMTYRADGHIEVYEPYSNKRLYMEDAPVGEITDVLETVDGLQVVSIGANKTVTVWDCGKLSRAMLAKGFQPAAEHGLQNSKGKPENPFKK
jgi:WD40 repeat protein